VESVKSAVSPFSVSTWLLCVLRALCDQIYAFRVLRVVFVLVRGAATLSGL